MCMYIQSWCASEIYSYICQSWQKKTRAGKKGKGDEDNGEELRKASEIS